MDLISDNAALQVTLDFLVLREQRVRWESSGNLVSQGLMVKLVSFIRICLWNNKLKIIRTVLVMIF